MSIIGNFYFLDLPMATNRLQKAVNFVSPTRWIVTSR